MCQRGPLVMPVLEVGLLNGVSRLHYIALKLPTPSELITATRSASSWSYIRAIVLRLAVHALGADLGTKAVAVTRKAFAVMWSLSMAGVL